MSQILNGEINLKDRMTNTLNKVNNTLKRMYGNMPDVVNGMNSAFTKIENRMKNFSNSVQNIERGRYNGMMQNHQRFAPKLSPINKLIQIFPPNLKRQIKKS